MKFIYQYRTSKNELMSGEISAPTRDHVYIYLKEKGIKPSKVEDAPGIFNVLMGRGKRWLLIVVLGLIALSLGLTLNIEHRKQAIAVSMISDFESQTRRQVIGDLGIVEKGCRDGWAEVFDLPGDRFLASYAIPGVNASSQIDVCEEDIRASLASNRNVRTTDSIEARQIVSIVAGMKKELREYLKNGGSIELYIERLRERQQEEQGYFVRANNELDAAKMNGMPQESLESLWECRNEQLRRMGIRSLPFPE